MLVVCCSGVFESIGIATSLIPQIAVNRPGATFEQVGILAACLIFSTVFRPVCAAVADNVGYRSVAVAALLTYGSSLALI